MPDVAQDPIVDELRARITAADADIVAAVNRRAAAVAALHAHKRARGYEVFDPAREERVVAAVLRANAGPLSDEGLRELYGVILPLCTREAARE
ncbi:MAG TPA: chorismate mutase [Gaiellales bacterium]|nr:chorismate mutase [Gaiellales bacterium]